MKSKILVILTLLAILTMMVATTAYAEMGDPAAGCPDNFQLHHTGHHHGDGEHMHHHIGNDTDFNGDGYICVKHVGANGNNHVHIDNRFPNL